ncbi:MAG: succinate dehydrogenase, cytochrome b556 subunit [Nitrosomonadaceae bacterium]|nr:succinate dehydrogenase, cytochrome b556 subunit [Nitrosomonadaceae bacterium]
MQRKRPKHLNLIEIKQPLPAVVSILHRMSGVLLFFPGIPVLLCSLQMALGSPQGYAEFQSFLANPLIKGASVLALWFLLHHFCAGIRHLALDLHYGVALEQARMSSKLVLVMGITLTLLIGAAIW